MKAEVLQSLLVARTLYDQARSLLHSDNKYATSAALVILQDAVELIMKAALIEKEVDEVKSFEKSTFDEIMAFLRDNGVAVKKTGTLKAMNKERVIVKHYGQLAEQASVRNYFDACEVATKGILQEVFGKSLHEIYQSELITSAEIRDHLASAEKDIANGKISDALLRIRMAIFIAIEQDYDIAKWANPDKINDLTIWIGRGNSAPYHTKDSAWIAQNVKEPFDFIQMNYEKIKIDLLEWGVNTQDFWNIWRLTPRVYRAEDSNHWSISTFELQSDFRANVENAQYCLDRAINLVLKKQHHHSVTRFMPFDQPKRQLVIQQDTPRLLKASSDAQVAKIAAAGEKLLFTRWLNGLDGRNYFQIQPDYASNDWSSHYVNADHCGPV
ncbi:hypothetical protein JZX87_10505 [Agrobacterium sp. Ap1]|uniref:hypothetical protein n=1 Tax=Agrobacterium sp. Ap1 TaxID=2815337 RepID=UPI001A8FA6F5|nr:hypothetical protein [Agrobacterium sp. Ap1]MBO0141588.1 hypothetical protein [Agrobacterium sp. Ap1]